MKIKLPEHDSHLEDLLLERYQQEKKALLDLLDALRADIAKGPEVLDWNYVDGLRSLRENLEV
jgi:hypothetical protein